MFFKFPRYVDLQARLRFASKPFCADSPIKNLLHSDVKQNNTNEKNTNRNEIVEDNQPSKSIQFTQNIKDSSAIERVSDFIQCEMKELPKAAYKPDKKSSIKSLIRTSIESSTPFVEDSLQVEIKSIPDSTETARKLEELAKLQEEMLEKVSLEYKNPDQFVFSDGSVESPAMFVGEAPGEDEVLQGKPFVGKSGRLLQQMLDAAGITRDRMYITNAVVWRPPLNRTPLPAEIEQMSPYLLRHIEIIKPKILVLIGGIAYRCAMREAIAISKIRGIWQNRDFCPAIMNIFHPSYLIRSPSRKKETWADILSIREKLLELGWPLGKGVLRLK